MQSEKYPYVITIRCYSEFPERNVFVETKLPEELETGFQTQWEDLIPEMLRDLNSVAGQGLGINYASRLLSPQRFSGNTPIELSIPVKFRATSNARAEVVEKVKDLMKMTVPVERPASPGLIAIPGPLFSPNDQPRGDKIVIKIANFITFENVIVTGISPRWGMKLSRDGVPMEADVTLSFRTYFPPTVGTIDKWFST